MLCEVYAMGHPWDDLTFSHSFRFISNLLFSVRHHGLSNKVFLMFRGRQDPTLKTPSASWFPEVSGSLWDIRFPWLPKSLALLGISDSQQSGVRH